MLEIQVFESFCTQLEAWWRQVECRGGHYGFQSYEWLSHWLETIGSRSPTIQPCVVVALSQGQPIAVFPFACYRRFGVRIVGFLGGEQSDYNTPLLDGNHRDKAKFDAIWQAAVCHLPPHDVRLFERLPGRLGGECNPMASWAGAVVDAHAYAANLPHSWNAFKGRLSAQFRSNSGRKWRRLSQLGNLRFVVATGAEQTNLFVEAIFAQKSRRLRQTGARDVMADPVVQKFYRGLTGQLSAGGAIHVSALMLDDQILAAHWGMVLGNRFYWILPTYAGARWESFSTGRLLLEQLIQWAIANNLKIFDFTVGGEEYKKIWCDSEMVLYRVSEVVAWRGYPFLWLYRLTSWLKTNPHSRRILMRTVGLFRSMMWRDGPTVAA